MKGIENCKKKIVIVGLIIAVALANVGCFPTEKRIERETIKENKIDGYDFEKEIPDRIQLKLGDNINVDATVSTAKEDSKKEVYAKLKAWNKNNVATVLFNNEKYEMIENNYEGMTGEIMVGENGSDLYLEQGYINYQNKDYQNKLYNIIIFGANPYVNTNDLKQTFIDDELLGQGKEEAKKNVEKLLNRLGISQLSEPEVISLEYKTMKEMERKEEIATVDGKEEIESFQKEDESYLFCYQVNYYGTNLTDKGYLKEIDDAIPMLGTRIYVVVNHGEIIHLKCENIYELSSEENNNVKGVSFEYILNKLNENYKNLILDNPLEVYSIDLEYVPVERDEDRENYLFEPYWVFSVMQDNVISDEKEEVVQTEYFNIYLSYETGEILEVGGTE